MTGIIVDSLVIKQEFESLQYELYTGQHTRKIFLFTDLICRKYCRNYDKKRYLGGDVFKGAYDMRA